MTWAEALDRFEALLDAQDARLEAGEFDDFPAFDPPGLQLGPVPGALRPRAEALLVRSRAIESVVAARVGATGRQLAVASRFADDRKDSRPPATYVDRGL